MTRRLKDFEISLQIKNENFIRPPRERQRNWLLNRSLNEFANNLLHLHELAANFVEGKEESHVQGRAEAVLEDEDIMEDWQIPLMEAMAQAVVEGEGDVLEVGFGRGISSTFIQEIGVRSHTIVECNQAIEQRLLEWRKDYPGRDIRVIRGRWQDTIDQLKIYDGIFYHTYPLDETEYADQVIKSTTFAESFFPIAASHLRKGGNFSYQTYEIDSLSREHQRLLLEFFSSFALKVVKPLNLPEDVRDAWWSNSMTVVKAVK